MAVNRYNSPSPVLLNPSEEFLAFAVVQDAPSFENIWNDESTAQRTDTLLTQNKDVFLTTDLQECSKNQQTDQGWEPLSCSDSSSEATSSDDERELPDSDLDKRSVTITKQLEESQPLKSNMKRPLSEYKPVMEQWSAENETRGLDPKNLYPNSHKKAVWNCSVEGHGTRISEICHVFNAIQKGNSGCRKCYREGLVQGSSVANNKDMMKLWSTKNKKRGLDPSKLARNSHIKAIWKCRKQKQHGTWKATIADVFRSIKIGQTGCRQCFQERFKPANCIANIEEMISQWSAENATRGLDPNKLGHGSHKIAIWECRKQKQHGRWNAEIKSVYNSIKKGNSGCPKCCKEAKLERLNNRQPTKKRRHTIQKEAPVSQRPSNSRLEKGNGLRTTLSAQQAATEAFSAQVVTIHPPASSNTEEASRSESLRQKRRIQEISDEEATDPEMSEAPSSDEEWQPPKSCLGKRRVNRNCGKKSAPPRRQSMRKALRQTAWEQNNSIPTTVEATNTTQTTGVKRKRTPSTNATPPTSQTGIKRIRQTIAGHETLSKMLSPNNPEGTNDLTTGNKIKKVKWRCLKDDSHQEWVNTPGWQKRLIDKNPIDLGCPDCKSAQPSKTRTIADIEGLMELFDRQNNSAGLEHRVTTGQEVKVGWRCLKNKDHTWKAEPKSILGSLKRKKTGCPHCPKKRFTSCPTIANHEALSKLFDRRKNPVDLDKTTTTGSRAIDIWWKCSEGHEWKAKAYMLSRSIRRGTNGCPDCKKVSQSTYPTIANYPLLKKVFSPNNPPNLENELTAGSDKKAKWICSEHGDFEAQVRHVKNARQNGNSGCLKCSRSKKNQRPNEARSQSKR